MGSRAGGSEVRYEGTCPCGKRSYGSRKQAKAAGKKIYPGDHLSAYRCRTNPNEWHFGHLHSLTIERGLPRDASAIPTVREIPKPSPDLFPRRRTLGP